MWNRLFKPKITSTLGARATLVQNHEAFDNAYDLNNAIFVCGTGIGLHEYDTGDSCDFPNFRPAKFNNEPGVARITQLRVVPCWGYMLVVLTTDVNGTRLYGCGLSTAGCLTLENTRTENNLTLMNTTGIDGKIVDVCCSAANIVVLTDTNKVYYSGLRIASNHNMANHTFVPLPISKKIIKIGMTATHLITLSDDHTVTTYTLGMDKTTTKTIQKESIIDFAYNAKEYYLMEEIPPHKFWDTSTSIGGFETEIGYWTENNEFFIQDGQNWKQVDVPVELAKKNIICMRMYMMNVFVLTESHELWVKGRNERGELGLGHNEPVESFVKVDLKYGDREIAPNDIACSIYGTVLLGKLVDRSPFAITRSAFSDIIIK